MKRADLHRFSEMKKILKRIWSASMRPGDYERLAGLSGRMMVKDGRNLMLLKFQGRGVLSPMSQLEFLCWRRCR